MLASALARVEQERVMWVLAILQVLVEELLGGGVKGVLARDATFQTVDPNPAILDALCPQERRFLTAQPMTIDQVKKKAISPLLERNRAEERLSLFFR